jgi:hypothetical protein
MIARPRQLLCLLAASAALAVAGCGGDDEPQGEKLPPDVAQTLLQQLESVGDRVAAGVSGACDDIFASESDGGNIEPIDAALSSIPSDVDPEIRSALEQSVERLTQLVDQQCDEIRADEQGQQDTVTDETPTETVPTETETVPTETETVPTDPTETTPTTPDAPETAPSGRGPDGTGPPGQDRGGAEAPDEGGD